MSEAYEQKVASLSLAKALAIGIYGESVASYRYRNLAEKAPRQKQRTIFQEMSDEEHGHQQTLQNIIDRRFPDADFVLTPADKELVIVGPRLLEVSDGASVAAALKMIYDSERLTGRYYAALHNNVAPDDLKPLMREMADECFDHAERLMEIKTT